MAEGIEIQVRGLAELSAILRALPEKISRRELGRSLREAAKPIVADAKRAAPVLSYSTPWRRAGALKRAIRAKVFRVRGSALNLGVTIGVSSFSKRKVAGAKLAARKLRKGGVKVSERFGDPYYWRAVESPKSGRRSRPFLAPAFERHRDRFANDFRDRLTARIEQLWREV